jgi:hypothetical protein
MKLASIILGVIAIAFIAVQVFALKSQKNIETYPYIVEKEYKDFQIRSYEATLFSSVKLSSNNFKEASGKGFSILAGYIFGNNKTNEKIAMTSPVAMTLEDSMTMLFMVPKKFNKESLPVPNQPQIKFQNEPGQFHRIESLD